MGATAVIPPPPAGFTLDGPSTGAAGAGNVPPPPAGFTLDSPSVDLASPPDPSRNGYAGMVAQMESGGKVGAVNANSGAAGTYQFTPSTAAQYGLTRADLTNPDPVVQQKVRAAFDQFTQDNAGVLTNTLDRAPNPQELYLAHQQGATGAGLLLKTPGAKAVDALLPAYAGSKDPYAAALAAVVQNGGTADMTAGDFAKLQAQRLSKGATTAMPDSAYKAVSAILPDEQIGQQPFVGKGTFGRKPGATQAPDEVGNALNDALRGAAHYGIDVPINSINEGANWLNDKLGLPTINVPGVTPPAQQRTVADVVAGTAPQSGYDKAVAGADRQNQLYDLTNAANTTAGKVGGIAGGIGAAMVTPGMGLLKGAGLLSTVGRGLLGGATYGAEQNSGTGNPFVQDVALNSALGGVGAGLLYPAAKIAGAVASKYFPRAAGDVPWHLRPPTGAVPPPGRIEPTFGPQAGAPPPAAPAGGPSSAAAGVTLKPGTDTGMFIPENTSALTMPEMTARAQARIDNFTKLGMTGESGPTGAIATRDPQMWTAEQNKAATEEGAALVKRYQNINAGLVRNLDQAHTATGADPAVTTYGVGQQIVDTVQAKSDEMQQAVSKIYQQVRAAVGDHFGMKPSGLFDALDKNSDIAAADPIITSIKRRLARLGIADPNGTWTIAKGAQLRSNLSINDAEELRKFINGLPATDGTTKMVKSALINALDDDVINSAGVDSFKAARDAARARFSEFEQKTLHSIQAGDMEPDKIFERKIIGGNVSDLSSLKTSLLSGTPEQIKRGTVVWNNVRGQTIKQLQRAAFGVDGGSMFKPGQFNKMIEQIGPERMKLLFTPEEISHLSRIQQAGSDAFSDVPLSAVNHSHSGTYLAQHLKSGIGKIAGLMGTAGKMTKVAGYVMPTPWEPLLDIGTPIVERAAAKQGVKAMLAPNIPKTAAATMRSAVSQRVAANINKIPSGPMTAAYRRSNSSPDG